jgi:hypothetical protein
MREMIRAQQTPKTREQQKALEREWSQSIQVRRGRTVRTGFVDPYLAAELKAAREAAEAERTGHLYDRDGRDPFWG